MIKLIAVGKIKEKALATSIADYHTRIKPYSKIEIIEIKDLVNYAEDQIALNIEVKEKEAQAILKSINDRDTVILIDLHGEQLDSLQFARTFEKCLANNQKDICFVIAGSLGFGESILRRANERICLSKLTFPHQIVRLLVLEQIYRAYKINKNEIYHK